MYKGRRPPNAVRPCAPQTPESKRAQCLIHSMPEGNTFQKIPLDHPGPLSSHQIVILRHYESMSGRAGAGLPGLHCCWPLAMSVAEIAVLNSPVAFTLMSALDCVSTQRLFHDCFTFCIHLVSDHWMI